MNSSEITNLVNGGHMNLETLWRLLEQQRKNNVSMASVVGLDETKFLVENNSATQGAHRHGMTTLG